MVCLKFKYGLKIELLEPRREGPGRRRRRVDESTDVTNGELLETCSPLCLACVTERQTVRKAYDLDSTNSDLMVERSVLLNAESPADGAALNFSGILFFKPQSTKQ